MEHHLAPVSKAVQTEIGKFYDCFVKDGAINVAAEDDLKSMAGGAYLLYTTLEGAKLGVEEMGMFRKKHRAYMAIPETRHKSEVTLASFGVLIPTSA